MARFLAGEIPVASGPANLFVTMTPPAPASFADWPRAHKLLSRWPLRRREDKGTGDTFFRYAHATGADKVTKGVEGLAKSIGLDWECGCTDRRARWNLRYPYDGVEGRPR